MSDHDNAQNTGVPVHAIFTETSVFVAPDGEKYPYLHLQCQMEGGQPGPSLLFNAGLTIGILDAITRYMGTVFGVDTIGQSLSQAMDEPIDWDHLPPPPDDIVDWDPDTEPDPDWRHDNG